MIVDKLYSAQEVAELLSLKTKTVQRKAYMAEWPHIRLPGYGGGNRYAFTEAQLQQILDMMTVNVPIKPAPIKSATSRGPRKSTRAKQKAS